VFIFTSALTVGASIGPAFGVAWAAASAIAAFVVVSAVVRLAFQGRTRHYFMSYMHWLTKS
jgi:hypothetical protein